MSYIQIEMGGKPRGLKFNLMAFMLMQDKLLPGNAVSGTYGLVYGALFANCYVKRMEPDFTFEDVCDWVDGLNDEGMSKIREAFEQSDAYKKGQAQAAQFKAKEKTALNKSVKATKKSLS